MFSYYKETVLREWGRRGAVREESLKKEEKKTRKKKDSKYRNGLCDANRHNLRMLGKSTRSLRSFVIQNSLIMNTIIQLEICNRYCI